MKRLQRFATSFFLLISLSIFQYSIGQQPDYASKPHWIKMMEDSSVNYFEAVKAFNTYWKDRSKPVEEKEIFSNYNQRKITTVRKTEREAKEYAIEYKKFLNWQRETLPYVQADGRILSREERLRIFEKEKQERQRGQ